MYTNLVATQRQPPRQYINQLPRAANTLSLEGDIQQSLPGPFVVLPRNNLLFVGEKANVA